MRNAKIKAVNAPQFIKHLEIVSKLSGVDYPYPFDIVGELVRLENRANRICTMQCNGEGDSEKLDIQLSKIEQKVLKLIPNLNKDSFFINGDPRGYSLKIKEEEAIKLGIYRDFGGYGILAPEF